MKKSLVYILICAFLSMPCPAYSDVIDLPAAGRYVGLSPNVAVPDIKGMKINPANPFNLDFIIDHGDKKLSDVELKNESERMIKYFLAILTIPQGDLWVNLSPYEKERITTNEVGITDLGKDMLIQDYILKQLTASLTHPDKELGRMFWKEVYKKASALYGNSKMPVNTFNKVWIVPSKASVYEKGNIVLITNNRLKVMMDEDYLAVSKNSNRLSSLHHGLDQELLRKMILPVIEREVNEGKNFALIRQIYNAFILAVWYKRNLKNSILNTAYSDQKKMAGIDVNDKEIKEKIYQQYLQAFKKGIYNLIKEDQDPATQMIIPRKYFSGGVDLSRAMTIDAAETVPAAMANHTWSDVRVDLAQQSDKPKASVDRALMSPATQQLMEGLSDIRYDITAETKDVQEEDKKFKGLKEHFMRVLNNYIALREEETKVEKQDTLV